MFRKTTTILISFIVILLLSMAGCTDKNDLRPRPLHMEYIPLADGSYIIYKVDSISFRGAGDTICSQLMEMIESHYTDLSGKIVYRVERYTRSDSSMPWLLKNVWTAGINDLNYERVEENMRVIRLKFPVDGETTWNGNLYNILAPSYWHYTKIHRSAAFGQLHFDSTTTVIEKADTTNLIKNVLAWKTYARGVGLIAVYADSLSLAFDPERKGDTTGGYLYRMTVIKYKN